jgi:hypothetical protein
MYFRWIGPGVLRAGSRVIGEGDLIPSDLLSDTRRDQFVKAGKIEEVAKAREAKPAAEKETEPPAEEKPKKKAGKKKAPPKKTAKRKGKK